MFSGTKQDSPIIQIVGLIGALPVALALLESYSILYVVSAYLAVNILSDVYGQLSFCDGYNTSFVPDTDQPINSLFVITQFVFGGIITPELYPTNIVFGGTPSPSPHENVTLYKLGEET